MPVAMTIMMMMSQSKVVLKSSRRLLPSNAAAPSFGGRSFLAGMLECRVGSVSRVENDAAGGGSRFYYSTLPFSGPCVTAKVFPQQQQQQQLRWKHASKMGHLKETLEELAHRPEREAAQERRQKKKEKAAKKKKGYEAAVDAVEEELYMDSVHEEEDEDHHHEDDEDDHHDETLEPTLPNLQVIEAKMLKSLERFQDSLQTIRGAEPTPEMFEDISVVAYGSPTPLKAVGQVVIVSPTLATITCFDPSLTKDVQKAIQLALEGLNPQIEDGGSGTIKVPLPRVSKEVREQTAKHLGKLAEATKQRIRQIRRKAMDLVKQGKDGKLAGISKDEAFACAKEMDALTERIMERLQKLVDEKMNSIMAV